MPSKEHEDVVTALCANPVAGLSFEEQRAFYEAAAGNSELPADVDVEESVVGGLAIDWVRAIGSRGNLVLVHLHGGGYVMGSNKIYREFAARLSRAAKAPVLLVDYRLAPKNPFPAAVEDTLAVYSWLLSRGIDPRHIMLSGDSAGGGLVVAALLAMKERGGKFPAGGICISPWVDLTLSGSTMAPGAVDDPLITSSNLAKMAEAYAKDNLSHPLASPLHGDLAGLPPLCILVGTREILLDDARRLNAAARKAGVQTEYLEALGMVHCWPVLAALAPESVEALTQVGRFVDAHITHDGPHAVDRRRAADSDGPRQANPV